jgi:TPR repeat protein
MVLVLLAFDAAAIEVGEYEKRCHQGNREDCFKAGLEYDVGGSAEKNDSKALEFYLKACDLDSYLACNNLAGMYMTGQGVKLDYVKSAHFMGIACEGGVGASCSTLGYLHYIGNGVKQDYLKAAELFLKGCDGGDMDGCHNLANMYLKGEGVEKVKSKAELYFSKACKGGLSRSCRALEVPEIISDDQENEPSSDLSICIEQATGLVWLADNQARFDSRRMVKSLRANFNVPDKVIANAMKDAKNTPEILTADMALIALKNVVKKNINEAHTISECKKSQEMVESYKEELKRYFQKLELAVSAIIEEKWPPSNKAEK